MAKISFLDGGEGGHVVRGNFPVLKSKKGCPVTGSLFKTCGAMSLLDNQRIDDVSSTASSYGHLIDARWQRTW